MEKELPKWKVFEASYNNATYEEKQTVLGTKFITPSWSNLTIEQRRLWMEYKKDNL